MTERYALSACHRQRLSKVADVIELMEAKFDMADWWSLPSAGSQTHVPTREGLHDCGTSACLGGTMQALWFSGNYNVEGSEIGELIGIDCDGVEDLFYPSGHDDHGRKLLQCKNPKVGAAVLRHLAETGVVDWEGVANAYFAANPDAPF